MVYSRLGGGVAIGRLSGSAKPFMVSRLHDGRPRFPGVVGVVCQTAYLLTNSIDTLVQHAT